MPKIRSCPCCADGHGSYYVVVKGADGLQPRVCPLPHNIKVLAVPKKKASQEGLSFTEVAG